MDKLNKKIKKSLVTAICLAVALIAGVPMLVIGAIHLHDNGGFVALMVFGIIFVAAGFYGAPLAFVRFGTLLGQKRLMSAIINEHFYTVDELAKYMRRTKRDIVTSLNKLVDNYFLSGYKFDGEKITLNENKPLAPTIHIECCSACGAVVKFSGDSTACPYCGALVTPKKLD